MYLEQLATVCGIELVLDTDFLFGLRVVPRSIRESAKVAGARLTALTVLLWFDHVHYTVVLVEIVFPDPALSFTPLSHLILQDTTRRNA